MKVFVFALLITQMVFAHGLDEWLGSLDSKQKELLAMGFEDEKRSHWHYVPQGERKGLAIRDMSAEQKKGMFDVLASVFSEKGMQKIRAVIAMEAILKEYEGNHRDPEKFYFSLYGKPNKGLWGFSFEGHHLSINFTFKDDKMLSGTPLFFGANPAIILKNKSTSLQQGDRPFALPEDLALNLIKSMNAEQLLLAHDKKIQQKDLKEGGRKVARDYPAEGLSWSQMSVKQQAMLMELIYDTCTDNLQEKYALDLRTSIDEQKDFLKFKYYGGLALDEPHHYQIIGESLIILFYNVQKGTQKTPVNHIHLLWRDKQVDFGVTME